MKEEEGGCRTWIDYSRASENDSLTARRETREIDEISLDQ